MMKCHICNQEFTCIQNLRKHNIDTHGIMKSFSCNICHKVFNKKNQLMSHRYEVHRGRIFSCGYCNKSFKRLGHLISHKYRIHNTAKKEKTATEISLSQIYKRSNKESILIQKTLENTMDQGKSQIIKNLVKRNPDMFPTNKDKLSENDIIELITDNNLSDRNILRILQKLRRMFGYY